MPERKTVLITGAASGFGYKTTIRFAQDPKYDIFAVDKNPNTGDCFPPDILGRVKAVQLDVRNFQQVGQVVDQIISEKGAIDVLVNNAGIMISGRVHTFFDQSGNPTEELRAMWETNLKAPLKLMAKALAPMRERRSGLIINITSTSPYNRTPHRAVYADFKAVFAGATQVAREKEAPFNIRVVNVEPGMHATALDSWHWTPSSWDNSLIADTLSAQGLYFWWRRRFATSPKKVADVIYKIAEGEILDDKVSVGWDSRFASFMYDYFPPWKRIFLTGYSLLHLYGYFLFMGVGKLAYALETIFPEKAPEKNY